MSVFSSRRNAKRKTIGDSDQSEDASYKNIRSCPHSGCPTKVPICFAGATERYFNSNGQLELVLVLIKVFIVWLALFCIRILEDLVLFKKGLWNAKISLMQLSLLDATFLRFILSLHRCAGSGYTSRWYHTSAAEHYCNECFDYYYRWWVLKKLSVVGHVSEMWTLVLMHP